MAIIKELMIMLYELLSEYAVVDYEEISRDSNGEVSLTDTRIVYNLAGQLQTTDNKVRTDIPLNIDIWYRYEDIYDIVDMADSIDKELSDLVWRSESGLVVTISRDTNFMLNITDDKPEIRRKQINYVIRYYI